VYSFISNNISYYYDFISTGKFYTHYLEPIILVFKEFFNVLYFTKKNINSKENGLSLLKQTSIKSLNSDIDSSDFQKNFNYVLFKKFSKITKKKQELLVKQFVKENLATQIGILKPEKSSKFKVEKRTAILEYLRKNGKYDIILDKNDLLSKYTERKAFLLNSYNEAIKNKVIVFPEKVKKIAKINFVREINDGYNRIIPRKIYKYQIKQKSYGFKARTLLKQKYRLGILDGKDETTLSYYISNLLHKGNDSLKKMYEESSIQLKDMLIKTLKYIYNIKDDVSKVKKKAIHQAQYATPKYPKIERTKRFWHVGYFNREFLRIINIYKGSKNLDLSAQFRKNMRLRFNKKTSKLELYLDLPKVNDAEKYYLKITNSNNRCERYPIRFIAPEKRTILIENFEKGFVYDLNAQRQYLKAKNAFIKEVLKSDDSDFSTAVYNYLNIENSQNKNFFIDDGLFHLQQLNDLNKVPISLDDPRLNTISAHIYNSNYSKITPAEIMDTIYFSKNQEAAFLWYIENII